MIMNTQKVRARLKSTGELLHQIADESQGTLLQLNPALIKSEDWLIYRKLIATLHQSAVTANNLADQIFDAQEGPDQAQAA